MWTQSWARGAYVAPQRILACAAGPGHIRLPNLAPALTSNVCSRNIAHTCSQATLLQGTMPGIMDYLLGKTNGLSLAREGFLSLFLSFSPADIQIHDYTRHSHHSGDHHPQELVVKGKIGKRVSFSLSVSHTHTHTRARAHTHTNLHTYTHARTSCRKSSSYLQVTPPDNLVRPTSGWAARQSS